MSEPLYLQQSDLPKVEHIYHYLALDLCEVCENLIPGQIIGAQCTEMARTFMVNTVNIIDINNTSVEIHDSYPTAKSVPNEKNVFRDVPFQLKDDQILNFLNNQKGIIVSEIKQQTYPLPLWTPYRMSEVTACQRCRCLGNQSSEVSKCDAYTEDMDVSTIRSLQYVL